MSQQLVAALPGHNDPAGAAEAEEGSSSSAAVVPGTTSGAPLADGDVGGGDEDLQRLQLHGSLWHLLRAKALAPSLPPSSSLLTVSAKAISNLTPATSPHAAAVVEVARLRASVEEGGGEGGNGGVTTSLSLRAVLHEASALAALLRGESGVAAGDRVAILLRNSPFFVVVQYAVAGAGAIAVNCNTRLTAPELRSHFADAGVQVVIADVEFAHTLTLALAPKTPATGDEAHSNAGIPSDTVLVMWAPTTPQQRLLLEGGGAASSTTARLSGGSNGVSRSVPLSPPSPPPVAVVVAGIERQRRLVFDSEAYKLLCAVDDLDSLSDREGIGGRKGSGTAEALRLPWTPGAAEGPHELGARYFQMMYTSGTTVGSRGANVKRNPASGTSDPTLSTYTK
jgi:acyl-CoA synthetase (AMP-forming)/AMP-acid ligase II